LVAEEALFFTCLRSEADCRDLPGLLLVGVGSLLFSGDDLSESDALPLPDPELEDPEELSEPDAEPEPDLEAEFEEALLFDSFSECEPEFLSDSDPDSWPDSSPDSTCRIFVVKAQKYLSLHLAVIL